MENPKVRANAKCHPDRKTVGGKGLCSACYQKKLYHSDPELAREKKRQQTAKNPERVKETQKKYRNSNPVREINRRLNSTYGLTYDEYVSMYTFQNGKCAICGSKHRLHIDHDHKTNTIRMLLCQNCNHGIGNAKDSIWILERMIQYLKLFGGK